MCVVGKPNSRPRVYYKETTFLNKSCVKQKQLSVEKCGNYFVQHVHLFTPHNRNRIFLDLFPPSALTPQRHKNNVSDLPS